jgi:hypothetical protein
MIGSTRENVNRSLAGLSAEGFIEIANGSITIVDPDGLRLLAIRAAPLLPPPNRPSSATGVTGPTDSYGLR